MARITSENGHGLNSSIDHKQCLKGIERTSLFCDLNRRSDLARAVVQLYGLNDKSNQGQQWKTGNKVQAEGQKRDTRQLAEKTGQPSG